MIPLCPPRHHFATRRIAGSVSDIAAVEVSTESAINRIPEDNRGVRCLTRQVDEITSHHLMAFTKGVSG